MLNTRDTSITNRAAEPHVINDDDLLIDLIISGNQRAYNTLVARYIDKVWKLSFSILKNEESAEDATQDVFLSVWSNITNWDKEGSARFSTWLYRITFNKCIDMKRRNKNHTHEEIKDIESPQLCAYKELLRKEERNTLNKEINKLPDSQKQAITLFYLHEMSSKEIASHTGKSENSIRSLLKRGRQSLSHNIDQSDYIS